MTLNRLVLVLELQAVQCDHEAAVIHFELENREYFAESISDRGDDYFDKFEARHRELLAEQEAGVCAYYVLVDEYETIAGRFNFYDLIDGTANVGYRVSRRFSGRGVATLGLRALCQIAHEKYQLRTLSATTSDENVASQRVLVKAGFVAMGTAVVAGKPGVRFELNVESLQQEVLNYRAQLRFHSE
jgi:[ribosomal protein S5]-alanine N-acetyltransferase